MPQGFRISGYGYIPGEHEAYDLAPAEGVTDDRCYPLKDGVVIYAGWDDRLELGLHPEWSRGLYVKIEHGNGEVSRYCHARRLVVFDRQKVTRDTPLGYMGDTGAARGKHWHIGFKRDWQGVDWLKEAGLG